MNMLVVENELRDLRDLSHKDQGDFEAYAQRLVGRNAYRILVNAGKGMREIADDICRMVRERSMRQPEQLELRIGKDASAQCDS